MVMYAPSGDHQKTRPSRKQIIEDIHKWTTKQKDYLTPTDKILVMGDYNADLESKQPKAQQFNTVLGTSELKPLNSWIHGHTYYSGTQHTIIDYIAGNHIAKNTLINIQVKNFPEMQTDHNALGARRSLISPFLTFRV